MLTLSGDVWGMSTNGPRAAAAAPDAESTGHAPARLRMVGIFADVSDAQLAELASGFSVRELQEGEVLIREGEQGHEFYVLTEGRLRIDRDGPNGDDVHLGDAVPGECVGDLALLRDAPRRATVTALKPSTVLVLERARFRSLLEAHPGARDAVEARIAHVERWTAARLHRPSAEEVVNQLSAVLPGVHRELLDSIEPEIQWVTLPRGTVLMREGDPADCVYFVVSGQLVAWTEREDMARLTLNEVGPGESVGEMALLGMGPRTATVEIVQDSELLRLSRRAFDDLLNSDPTSGAILARIVAARLQRALKLRSTVAQLRTVPMITAEECEQVVANEHLMLRNLKVTEGYYRLSVGMTLLIGHQDANWLTYACNASKTVGSFIRRELPRPSLGRGLSLGNLSTLTRGFPALAAVAERLGAAVDAVSELTSAGNIKVFAELGPIFARVIAAYHDCDRYDRDEFERFLDSLGLRSGASDAGGQDTLRQALVHYHDAMFQPEPKRKSELILLANFKVGLHEQIRLQPNIEGAMNAPLRAGVFDVAALRPFGIMVREPTMVVWRRFATRTMMRYRLPYGAVAVSGELPALPSRRRYPDVLTQLELPELRMVADRYDAPARPRWFASRDWANLEERMTFIFQLFRSRQKSLELFDPPFQYEQRLAIAGDLMPAGPL
jgi:CRP-like cAMP-binding protein